MLPLAARAAIVDLIDPTLLCLGGEGVIPKDLFDFLLLLFESIQRSARSTLGSLLRVGFLEGCLLEAAIGFVMAMDKSICHGRRTNHNTCLSWLSWSYLSQRHRSCASYPSSGYDHIPLLQQL
jgi:hypothetical protein